MKEENQMIIKALNMYGRVPETWELLKEIERLNNIINELDEHIVIKLKEFNTPEEYYTLKQIDDIHYRLQELKGSVKDE